MSKLMEFNLKRCFYLLIILTLAIFPSNFISLAIAQLADSPWPMFQHDAQHTGRSPYVGPQSDTLKWQNEVCCHSVPIIGPNGTIYGSGYGYLYAINPSGIMEWKYEVADGYVSAPAISPDNVIYFSGKNAGWNSDDCLYALNLDSTIKKWRK